MSTGPSEEAPALGIVIPTLNEASTLPDLLADLRAIPVPTRVVVPDGGSVDRTVELARAGGALVLRTTPSRGGQMNAGALAIGTPWILFLHADSRVPEQTIHAMIDWMRNPSPCEAAHFGFQLDRKGLGWTLIEGGQRLRERVTGWAYGDQGLLLSRRRFESIGGIADLPLMEDLETIRRLRRTGGVHRIEAPIVTSSRRYQDEGRVLGVGRNVLLLGLYALGAPPHRLARWYRPAGGRPSRSLGLPHPSR